MVSEKQARLDEKIFLYLVSSFKNSAGGYR